MDSFEQLTAWQTGMQLVKEVYAFTQNFPASEQFGLTAQLRRASTSILANLSEGYARKSASDKAYKYVISRGECSETHALILISIALGYLSAEQAKHVLDLAQHTGKLLTGLIRAYSHL
ncbi:MAG: four helix bundle protein [Candidatus Peribacteraceae bacterium]|nr:four helix bundle protein [Candidatus Peribacteria bacterium]